MLLTMHQLHRFGDPAIECIVQTLQFFLLSPKVSVQSMAVSILSLLVLRGAQVQEKVSQEGTVEYLIEMLREEPIRPCVYGGASATEQAQRAKCLLRLLQSKRE